LIAIAVLMVVQLIAQPAIALEVDEGLRTVTLNDKGESYILSLEEVAVGKRQFNYACGQCHVGGVTKTDPNIGLEPETLALATPPRNNIEALVDYMNNPTTYDGLEEISERHPSTKSTDIYPKMRNLTQDDLKVIAGHILMQPKVLGDKWGGGKIYN
jgi:photosystem II cytochrome c550